MKSESRIDNYLDSLRDDGKTESESSQFTIDPFKGQKKLQLFRLTEPELCILPIISAAIMGGAMVVNVEGNFRDLTITFDGRIWTHVDFPEMLSSNLEMAREFQVGLSAAQALQPSKIRFVSKLGTTISELAIKDGRPTVRHWEAEQMGEDFNRLELVACDYKSYKDLYELLQERCCFSPRVAWRGHRLIRKSPPHTAARLELLDERLDRPSVVVSAWVSRKVSDLKCSGHIWTTAESQENDFTFLLRSVAYKKPVLFKKYRGLHGVIHAPDLKLDISRGGIVEDQNYLSLMEGLESAIDTKLMPLLKRDLRGMPGDRKKVAEKFLGQWRAGLSRLR